MASVLLPESGVWFQVKIATKDKALSGRVLECRVKTPSWFDMDVTLTNMEGDETLSLVVTHRFQRLSMIFTI